MTDMVERVGRALDDAWNSEGNDLPPIELSRDERVYLARAAIEAMREPSEGMATEGELAVLCRTLKHNDRAVVAWRRMIDTTLSQSGDSPPSRGGV